MDTTPNLALPYILAQQAQKHVTHNEALRALDALVQLSALDKDLAAPPASPADGAAYIVAASPTGAWAGQTGRVAAYQDGAWAFYAPREGWLAWVADEDKIYAWSGTAWILTGSVNPVPMVGVNATADATNRLAVSSPASLFNHEGGGHQLKVNKAAAAQTASLLLQDAFSGRAELGLAGDDNLHVKVSADGTTWNEALVVDRTTAEAVLPFSPGAARPNLLVNGDLQINQRGFAGGARTAGSYGHDRWKADTGGANWSVSGYTVTLTSGTMAQVVEPAVFGLANLASTTLTVSVDDLTGGSLTVTAGAATGTITAGAGRRSVALTTAAGDTGNLAIKLAPASGAVTFKRVKAEVGGQASAWAARPATQELALCQRYYCKNFPLGTAPADNVSIDYYAGFAWSTASISAQFVHFPVEMRAAPTVTFYKSNAVADSTGRWQWYSPDAGAYQASTAATTANPLTSRGFSAAVVSAGTGLTTKSAYIVRGGWTAEAEL